MKNKFLSILIICFIVFPLVGCDTSDSNNAMGGNQPIPIRKAYWQLASNNTSVTLYKNLGGMRGLEFLLVTAFQFKSEDLKISLDISDPNVSYQSSCTEIDSEEEDIFPFYLYQCYQGMDWQLMKETSDQLREQDGNKSSLEHEFKKLKNRYLEDYEEALQQNKLPKLYEYRVGVSFNLDRMQSVEQVTAITLTLSGETKTYQLDDFILDGKKEFSFENSEISQSLAISDAPIEISTDGIIDSQSMNLKSDKPFTLTGVSLLEEESTKIIDSLVSIIDAEGEEIETKWDGKTPIPVRDKETVRLQVFFKDSKIAGVMEAQVSQYILIEYSDEDGRPCTESVQGIYRMRQGLYDLYSIEDGVNVLDYYLKYYSLEKNNMLYIQ